MKTLENVVVLSLEDYEQLMRNQKPEELEIGKWYKAKGYNQVVYKNDTKHGYGFVNEKWNPILLCSSSNQWEQATNLEVYESLKKHALSLGFDGHFSFTQVDPTLFKCDGITIFNNGIWDKPKPKIDYSRLKTGSVVKLKHSGNHCEGLTDFDLNKPATILLYKAEGFYYQGTYRQQNRLYTTFVQGQNTSHFTTYNEDYITEVISY